MIYLYDFEATKAMMDRVGEPAELKPVRAKRDCPPGRRLVTLLQSMRASRRSQIGRPAAARPAATRSLTERQETGCS